MFQKNAPEEDPVEPALTINRQPVEKSLDPSLPIFTEAEKALNLCLNECRKGKSGKSQTISIGSGRRCKRGLTEKGNRSTDLPEKL